MTLSQVALILQQLVYLQFYLIIQEHSKGQLKKLIVFIKNHGRVPRFQDRLEVPCSIAIIKESMRYRPTSPFGIPNSVLEDDKHVVNSLLCI